MNRQQRRKVERQNRKHKRPLAGMTQEQKAQSLIQHGITLEDLDKAYKDGMRKAMEGNGVISTMKVCYAAAALVLHEDLGFGRKRICKFLRAMDEKVLYNLSSQEIIDQVYEKAGVTMYWDEPFDRVEENEVAGPWVK